MIVKSLCGAVEYENKTYSVNIYLDAQESQVSSSVRLVKEGDKLLEASEEQEIQGELKNTILNKLAVVSEVS